MGTYFFYLKGGNSGSGFHFRRLRLRLFQKLDMILLAANYSEAPIISLMIGLV